MAEHFSRRDLFKQLGLAGVAVMALPELTRVLLVRRSLDESGLEEGAVFLDGTVEAQAATLTAAELRTLDAICARLIPTDDSGPGAKEAKAAVYIDRALGGALSAYRDEYSAGLAAINVYAKSKQPGAESFADLTADGRDSILREMEQDAPLGSVRSSAGFFNLLRGHTLQGTFCDPVYGGNANLVGWELIGYPGVRLSVAASEQNMSTPASRNHKSAYDYVMFSRNGL